MCVCVQWNKVSARVSQFSATRSRISCNLARTGGRRRDFRSSPTRVRQDADGRGAARYHRWLAVK